MKKKIRGPVYVLDDNIDTDQIIPAQHLVYDPTLESERKMYGKFALDGVPDANAGLPQGNIPFVKEGAYTTEFRVVVAGKNFGCGSSREHAPLALNEAGIEAVVACTFARIFYRNAVNGGYLIPYESEKDLSKEIKTGQEVEIDVEQNRVTVVDTGETFVLKPLGEVLPIIEAGDVFAYARQAGLISK